MNILTKIDFNHLLLVVFMSMSGVIFFLITVFFDIAGKDYLLIFFTLLFMFFGTYYGVYRPLLAIYLLIILFVFQTFFIILLAPYIDSLGIKLLNMVKEFYILSIFFAFIYKRLNYMIQNILLVDITILLLTLWALFQFLVPNDIGMFIKLVSLREIVMISLLYFIGRMYPHITQSNLLLILTFLVYMSIFSIVFGLFERVFFTGEIWEFLGATDFFEKKFSNANFNFSVYNNIPQHWYTYIADERPRRMVSFIGDAGSLSRFLATSLLFTTFVMLTLHNGKYLFYTLILGLGILLTIGRGGIIIVLLGIWVYISKKSIFLSILSIIIVLLASLLVVTLDSANTARHLTGLILGLQSLLEVPFGHGMGSSGVMAVMYSSGLEKKVEESLIGVIAFQLGLPGLIFYTLFFVLAYKKINHIKNSNKILKVFSLLSLSLIIGIYFTSILSQSAVAPISAGIPLFIIGYMVTLSQQIQKKDCSI